MDAVGCGVNKRNKRYHEILPLSPFLVDCRRPITSSSSLLLGASGAPSCGPSARREKSPEGIFDICQDAPSSPVSVVSLPVWVDVADGHAVKPDFINVNVQEPGVRGVFVADVLVLDCELAALDDKLCGVLRVLDRRSALIDADDAVGF